MKKVILVLLCCAMIVTMISCNINDVALIFNNTGKGEVSENTVTSIQNEECHDAMELSQLELDPRSDLAQASIWVDKKEEYYMYINEWDSYRHMPELPAYNSIYFNGNCIVVDSETATIAVIAQAGKHDEPTIITYRFNRANNFVELHTVPLNSKASSEHDTFLVNMHDANHGYYFLTPNMFGNMDDRLEGDHKWPLFMFETTDGGKTWNQLLTNTFYVTKYIEIFKFVSPQVGIISARDEGTEELFDRTYLTVDGGLTWTQISQLPHGEVVEWYSNIIDLEYFEDYYRLTVEACNYTKFQVQLWSKDLINWSLTEF